MGLDGHPLFGMPINTKNDLTKGMYYDKFPTLIFAKFRS